MGVRRKKVMAQDLEIGMFVADLDRPWHSTPFPIQGFHVRSQEDINSVSTHCKWVMIDVAEGRDVSISAETGGISPFSKRRNRNARGASVRLPPIQIKNPKTYDTSTPMKKEVRQAQKILKDSESALAQVFARLETGDAADLQAVSRSTRAMVDSVVRNPDALLWLTRIREHDDYTYSHSLNAAVWALIFGRYLGLGEDALHCLGMGTQLSHVGKLDLSADLIRQEQDLDDAAETEYHRYVDYGVERLRSAQMAKPVLSVVEYHCERHNGSGFPKGVRGDEIPLLAKIAGLADYYESLIEPRGGRAPMAPAKAVTHLYGLRNILFQEDLVERFIQSIGLYPTGTLVELSDGQRGAVISHSPERRLWPRVLVMTDSEHQPLKKGRILNLAEYNEDKGPSDTLNISACLPFGTDGLNPGQYEISSGATNKWGLKRLVG